MLVPPPPAVIEFRSRGHRDAAADRLPSPRAPAHGGGGGRIGAAAAYRGAPTAAVPSAPQRCTPAPGVYQKCKKVPEIYLKKNAC